MTSRAISAAIGCLLIVGGVCNAEDRVAVAEDEVYIAVYREAIERWVESHESFGTWFFLSVTPLDSESPEPRKVAIRNASVSVLSALLGEGLLVKPGTAAHQPQPALNVLDQETDQPGVRLVVRRVSWKSDVDAIVACQSFGTMTDGRNEVFQLHLDDAGWSVVSVTPES